MGDLVLEPLIIGTMARRGDRRQERLRIYRDALALGLTSFDTAPLYGFGEAERILGEALHRQPRESLQILGKVGLRWDGDVHGDRLFEFEDATGQRRQVKIDSRPGAIQADVDGSLSRLRTDYLDLVQIHHPDIHTPIDETMGALLELRDRGKVRHIGVSNFSLEQTRAAQRALGDVPLFSVQEDYSLVQRRVEAAVLPHCREQGTRLLAYSPLGGGLLARDPRHQRDAAPRLLEAWSTALEPIAHDHGVRPSAVALAWLLAQPGVTAAITGLSTPEQLREQVQASAVALSMEERRRLASAFAGVEPLAPAERRRRRLYRKLRGAARRALERVGVSADTLRRLRGTRRW
jgi:aryl-alcohol dehydrogenase-like predicted oxidoreductase